MGFSGEITDRAEARKAVLDYLRRTDYRPLTQRELLHRMHVPGDVRPTVRDLLQELIREGRVSRIRGNRLVATGGQGRILGGLEIREGEGIVTPTEGGPPVVVPRRALGDARHRDTVLVRLTGRGRRGRPEGAVVAVVARADRTLLGLFRTRGRSGVVLPFDSRDGGEVHVPASFRHEARDGDAVRVELLPPRRSNLTGDGKVLEVIGALDAPGVDTRIVAARYGLPDSFPRDAIRESERLPARIPPSERQRRERFDDPAPVTIDGETAKDFDDAVAVQELRGGRYRLFVHIADVAHFVAPDSALDVEARARGTSVYFPGTVVPMFPERLSNELCSLLPRRDRLVQSAILDLDAEGNLRRARFADGVIRSAARLTYTQVADALDGNKGHGIPSKLLPMLRAMDRLREALQRKRSARGSVDFDLPEPQILLDVEGVMTGVTISPRNRAHLMIEEFMLAANEAVASWLGSVGSPCVYRIHEPPDPTKLDGLREFVAGLGLRFTPADGQVRSGDIQRLLREAEGRPEYPVVAQVALRSMKQARYTTENQGHFGLAAPIYCHFTSPIRRYPDLVVHRLLRARRRRKHELLAALARGLEGVAEASSALERNAEAAERELLAWKAVVFMQTRVGETFEGVVVGVAPFGVFVRLTETQVEGLLRVDDLGNDWYDFVDASQELRGRSTGQSFRLGQALSVRVVRVDTVLRRIDLAHARDAEGGDAARTVEERRAASSPRRRSAPRRRGGGRPARGRRARR